MLPLLGGEKSSAVHIFIGHTYFTLPKGQHVVRCDYAELPVGQTITQYTTKRDLQDYKSSGEITLYHSPVYRMSGPKHAVSGGLMTLAQDRRPEANTARGFGSVWIAT